MKKRFLIAALALSACFSTFAACDLFEGKDPNLGLPVEKEETVSITLSYDLESGIISWDAVAAAKEYSVLVSYYRGETTEVKTSATSYEWPLKAGVSLIKVTALDENGKELAIGVKNMELDVAVGAPAAPTALSYDRATGTLSWTAPENAASYLINATGITDPTFVLDNSLTASQTTSAKLDLPSGIYLLSVSALSDKGAQGYATTIEWASYEIPEFNEDTDGDGVYTLFDFEDEGVLELARPSDYSEWTATVDEVGYDVVEEWVTDESGENTAATPSKMLAVKQEEVLDSDGNAINYFGGVTIRLPEQIEFGSISFDAYRDCWVGFGVMFEDENGEQANTFISWDETASRFKLAYYTVTMSELLAQNPKLTGVREITFYSRNGKAGNFYFDNVCYDPVGEIEEISLAEDKKTLTWNEVIGADGYKVWVNGVEVYDGENTSVELSKAYDTECAFVEIAVKKGDNESIRTAEKLVACYCDVCDGFNEAVVGVENGYYVADFTKHGYENNLAADGVGSYTIVNASHVEYTSTDDWSSIMTYALPTAIEGVKIASLNFTIQRIVGSFTIRIYETGGRYAYANLGAWNQVEVTAADGEWITIKPQSFDIYAANGTKLEGETWDGTIAKIEFRHANNTNGVAPIYSVKNVYYTVDTTNFGDKKTGTDEYYLADFSVAGYESYLTAKGTTTYTMDGYLDIEHTAFYSDGEVRYVLPKKIAVAEIATVTVRLKVCNLDIGFGYVYLYDETGACVQTMTENCTYITYEKGQEWLTVTFDLSEANCNENKTWSGKSLTSIGFGARTIKNDNADYIFQVDEVTYTKAVTE